MHCLHIPFVLQAMPSTTTVEVFVRETERIVTNFSEVGTFERWV